MTIPTDISSQTFLGNNVTSTFTCNFVPGASDGSNLQVATYTSSTIMQILPANLYSVNIGAPAPGEIWPTSFTVTYPLSGPAMSNNMFLSVSRILPFTQDIPYSNQGNIWPTAVETGVDTLEMQIQQIAARSTQFRGGWKSGVLYNLGDIVQDGTNGANTNNYYICQLSNTSSVWSTDLAAGDWALAVQAIIPSSAAPTITLSGAVAGSGTTSIVTTQQAQSVSNSALFFMSNNTIKSNISGALGMPGDNTLTAIMDALFGTLQGTIVFRGAASWSALSPGSSGTILTAQGLNTNPIWGTASTTLSFVTNSLTSDVTMTTGGTYYDGPSVPQGTSGTWFASGTITIVPGGSGETHNIKLWDGTTIIASTGLHTNSNAVPFPVSLSGYLSSPAANIRISATTSANASPSDKIAFNASGNSKDSTLTAIRIA